MTNLPKTECLHAAALCEIVYPYSDDKADLRKEVLELLRGKDDAFKYFDLKDTCTQAIVATSGDTVHLAFRGSESPVDWGLNAFLELKPYKSTGHCHSGFLHAANKVFPTISAEVERQAESGKKFVFSGHSLGGAMAVMTAVLFREKYPFLSPPLVITFGQPRTGNRAFIKFISEIGPRYIRFKNEGDRVPDVPPPFMKSDWSQCGELVFFDKDGNVQTEDEGDEGTWKRLSATAIAMIQMWQAKTSKDDIAKFASGPHNMKLYRERVEKLFGSPP